MHDLCCFSKGGRRNLIYPHLEAPGYLLAGQLADVSGVGHYEDDEVVHGAANGEGFGVVVESVAAGEIHHQESAVQLVDAGHVRVAEVAGRAADAPQLVQQSSLA